jgi:hypothetical protein
MDEAALLARFAALRAPIHAPVDNNSISSSSISSISQDAVAKSAADAADEDAAIQAVADGFDIGDDGDLAAILASLGVGDMPNPDG